MATQFEAGEIFERPHPFTWVEERGFEPDDVRERWRPGAWESVASGPDSVSAACHGEGRVVFTVISTHRPPGYPTRVFFTRQFFDPEGKPYARSMLKNSIASKFVKDINRFPFDYEVVPL